MTKKKLLRLWLEIGRKIQRSEQSNPNACIRSSDWFTSAHRQVDQKAQFDYYQSMKSQTESQSKIK